MRLMRFQYKVHHISGKKNVIADALSSSEGPISETDVMFIEVEIFPVSALHNSTTSPRLKELKVQQENDEAISCALP